MKAIKFILNLCLLFAAIFLGYSYITKQGIFQPKLHNSPDVNISNKADINTNFTLTNQDGVTISSKDFLGKHMLVFFGFSSCKTICPMELGLASQVLDQLGDKANKLQVIFITIDPARDTVSTLKEFHKNFDSRIQMLTGSIEAINEVVKGYKAYVGKPDNDNQIDHSGIMYIVDKKGEYLAHFAPELKSQEPQVDKLLSLIKQYL
ncbi:SCO family protein [Ehrlichia ruminantium]|uniref:SCO family protein n=1 Tax=Ehrlichia ruminantium TaxID=779 RepID=A0AAE6Q8M8_EHRRU|nr:SCO family protein [Ehrlichia ruminantium]QGR02237.1 SCO family protein [Ehrlichia ruminantium]QGR03159.1 SCO family protein [Ehrlichia ruminantium]QGR04084.1 SCO family protein [Ehrlichia ruminantium]